MKTWSQVMLHQSFILLLNSHCTIISLQKGISCFWLQFGWLTVHFDYTCAIITAFSVYKCLPDLFWNRYPKEPSCSLSESSLIEILWTQRAEVLQTICAFYIRLRINWWHQFSFAGEILGVRKLDLLHICLHFRGLIEQDARQQGSCSARVLNQRLASKNLEGAVLLKAGALLNSLCYTMLPF